MEEKRAKFEEVALSSLIPYARNARHHTDVQIAQIAASINEFGFLSPLVISKDNTILCGHGRYYAAQKLGLKTVPCVREEYLTPEQRRAYIIADNKLTLNSDWDDELLKVELDDLSTNTFDLALTGFSDDEIASLLKVDDAREDDYEIEDELEKPKTAKIGDIWTLGEHRLFVGDATQKENIDALTNGEKVSLVLTDPPYNVNYEGKAGKIQNDNQGAEEFYSFLLSAFKNMHSALKDDGSIYVFHADTEGLNFRRAFEDAGFYLSGCCIWKKPSLVLGRSPYQWQHEPVLYGWKKGGKHEWYTGRKETTIWEFEKSKRNREHPTMKPIALLVYPIQNSSKKGEIVLDPFAGSGSTMVASDETGRVCYMVENDEKYADVIIKRYIALKGTDESVSVLRGDKRYTFKEVEVKSE